jgi:hypothetical protein
VACKVARYRALVDIVEGDVAVEPQLAAMMVTTMNKTAAQYFISLGCLSPVQVTPPILRVMCVIVLFSSLTGSAAAQERPAAAVEGSVGWIGFADDGVVSEGMIGADVRWYLSPRVSVGPEVVYISGRNHSHLVATGNVTYDVMAAPADVTPRLTVFVVGGAGLFQTRETFFSGPYTSREGAFTAGGGVRGAVSNRMTVGVDARIGWELHIRVNGFVGVRLR